MTNKKRCYCSRCSLTEYKGEKKATNNINDRKPAFLNFPTREEVITENANVSRYTGEQS